MAPYHAFEFVSESHSLVLNLEPADFCSLLLLAYAPPSGCFVIDEPEISMNSPLKDRTFSTVSWPSTLGGCVPKSGVREHFSHLKEVRLFPKI